MSDTFVPEAEPPSAGVFRAMASILNSMGLGTLFNYTNASPGGRLWEWITDGLQTGEELYFQVEQTPEFAAQYGVILEMRKQQASNPKTIVPSVRDVLDYRQSFSSLLRYYRMPASFYDQASDADAMLMKGITVGQVQAAMEEGWQQVSTAPKAVQEAFTDYYGPSGLSEMAAFFMDPERITAGVGKLLTAARFGGFARSMGMGRLDKDLAETAAGLGGDMTEAQLRDTMTTASTAQRASRRGAEEVGDPLSAGEAIVDVALGANPRTREALSQRLGNRANRAVAGGGVALSGAGVSGLREGGSP